MTYFDPYAEAQSSGFATGRMQGRRAGRKEGRREGLEQGYDEGEQDGYNIGFIDGETVGWNKAVAEANIVISQKLQINQQHMADKERLVEELAAQRKMIDELNAKVDGLERENSELKQSSQGLRKVITALKETNEKLQAEVIQLDDKLKKKTKEYNDHLWNYNKCAVFMNSVRCVLEDLTNENGPHAEHVRGLFAKRYAEHIEKAMKNGTIRMPLDQDEALSKAMPKTQKFIQDMLHTVTRHAPENIRSNFSLALDDALTNENAPAI